MEDLFAKIRKEPIYLINEFADAVFRTDPSGKVFCKLKGQKEFETSVQSSIFKDVFAPHYTITQKEYEQY